MVDIEYGRPERVQPAPSSAPVQCRRVGNAPAELILYTTEFCPSTMDLARDLAAEERFPEWASVLAGSQSSGRGQFNRRWHSPPGNVYGSLRLPPLGPAWSNLVSLVLAESLYGRLKELGLAPSIKWPNDLLVAGKKVGGILVEDRPGLSIAGLGLNLVSTPQAPELRHSLAPPSGCLREFDLDLEPLGFWLPFVRHTRWLVGELLTKEDPEEFVTGLNLHLAYVGERILLEPYGAAAQPVIFQGIDAGGGIRVQTIEGERIFRSGSIYPVV